MVSTVLIESDWNLKYVKRTTVAGKTVGINRIRLEFKVAGTEFKVNNRECINRIRLEFKGGQHPRHCPNRPARINRIRLEFKDNGRRRKGIPMVVLIESDWNLKRNRKTG